jgi:transcriptional regulator with XRE-family HTH domain
MADTPGSLNDGLVRAIRAAFRGMGLSQKQFARKVGIHETTMSGYMTDTYSGRTVMTTDAIEAIASALGIDEVALFTEAAKWRARMPTDWTTPPDM